MLNLLTAISEFERDLLSERIKSRIAHALTKGKRSGRSIGRPSFNQCERVRRLLDDGKSVRAVAAEMGISKSRVMKAKAL